MPRSPRQHASRRHDGDARDGSDPLDDETALDDLGDGVAARDAEADANPHDEGDFDDRPSKSSRKRDMHELQALGEQLVGLPNGVMRSLDLPERLVDAVVLARGLRSHEGRRRQMQFIGKLMRNVDPEPIRSLLARREKPHRDEVAAMHLAERWRERLIADDRELEAFVRESGGGDLQSLRATIRSARSEHAAQNHGRQYRLLYRRIHDALLAAAGGGAREGSEDGSDDDTPHDGAAPQAAAEGLDDGTTEVGPDHDASSATAVRRGRRSRRG